LVIPKASLRVRRDDFHVEAIGPFALHGHRSRELEFLACFGHVLRPNLRVEAETGCVRQVLVSGGQESLGLRGDVGLVLGWRGPSTQRQAATEE